MDGRSLILSDSGEPGTAADSIHDLPRGNVLDTLRAQVGEIPRVLLPETEDEDQSRTGEPSDGPAGSASWSIGRYRINSWIGGGAMGDVFRGRDTDLGREIALKALREDHRGDTKLARRFVEEAQIGGQLVHPGIVPTYELGRLADGRPFFTMKLVQGRTLHDLLAARGSEAADLPRFLSIFEAVCQTVAYAHARGVIHRDLKPSNIMVGGFGEVQVMDWGLAKVLPRDRQGDCQRQNADLSDSVISTVRSNSPGDATEGRRLLGTPAYMAPEQARGDPVAVDERADVFGLGSILCEILTGKPAYTGPSQVAIIGKAERGEVNDAFRRLDATEADAELIDLARRCLSPAREDRPGDAGKVSRGVTEYLGGVQNRLRLAELAKVEADARVEEEAKRRVLAEQLATEARARLDAERTRRRMAMGLMVSMIGLTTVVAGGMTWVERQQRAQAAKVDVVLEKATWLTRAAQDAIDDSSRLAAASEVVEQLKSMEGDARDDATRARIGQLDQVVADIRRHRPTIEKLAEIRSLSLDDPDGLATEAGYSDALISAGLRVYDQTPDEVGAAIRARPPAVAEALAAALDDWAAVLRDRYGQANQPSPGTPGPIPFADPSGRLGPFGMRSPFPARGHMMPSTEDMERQRNLDVLESFEPALAMAQAGKLTFMARAADPDPWRNRLREAFELEDRDQRSKALVRIATDERIADHAAAGLDLLGRSLFDLDNVSAAEDVLRAGLKRHPRDLWLNHDLGVVLLGDGRRREAIIYLTAARAIRPEVAHELGHALDSLWERPDAAVAVFEDLTRLRPERARHWLCLAAALRARGHEAKALESEQKALKSARDGIGRDPDDAEAHHALGVLLSRFGMVPDGKEAVTELLIARRLRPGDASIDLDLHEVAARAMAFPAADLSALEPLRGLTTLDRLAPEDVKDALADAARMSNLRRPRSDLEAVRKERKRLEAESRSIEAATSKVESRFGQVLGTAKWWDWSMMGQLGIGYLSQRTFRRRSRSALHGHSGRLQYDAAALREVIERRPEDAEPHAELAALLMSDGKVEEAMAEFRRALDLEPPDSPLAVEAARRLADAERRALLADRLPRIISGEEQPDGGEDLLSYAEFASGRRLYAAAVRLYERAMADDPKTSDPRSGDHRFRAACAAAQAGCGLGFDQPAPGETERMRLRSKAREWLRADLAIWARGVAGHARPERKEALDALNRWRSAYELDALRNEAGLSKLPRSEQTYWRSLWTEVGALVLQARDQPQDE
jgi:serine/threonine-protein kinase